MSGPGTGLSVRSAYLPIGSSDRTLREIDTRLGAGPARCATLLLVSDPFRSELESAHARNAQLCDENARLRKELETVRQPSPRPEPTGRMRLAALVLGGLFLLASLFFLTARSRATAATAAQAASPGDYRGIAIATPAQSPGASEEGTPRPTGNAGPRPESQRGGTRPCTCAKGDPLCDCCNPPFVEDSSGNKIFKAGCL